MARIRLWCGYEGYPHRSVAVAVRVAAPYAGCMDETSKRERLYPFRFFDPVRRRWVDARYKATQDVIATRYEKWEITGPGWIPPDVDRRSR